MEKSKNSGVKFEPVQTQKASELIFEQIKEMIISGKLKPGERLPSERALIAMFEKSRPTIREALRMLESNGFIRTKHGSIGSEVVALSDKYLSNPLADMISMNRISYEEIGEMRVLLEEYAVKAACRNRTEAQLKKMYSIQNKSNFYKNDVDKFFEYDLLLHDAICEASGNRLAVIVDNVCHELLLFILRKAYDLKPTDEDRTAMINEIYYYHGEIIKCIDERNQELASKMLLAHLHRFSIACSKVALEFKKE